MMNDIYEINYNNIIKPLYGELRNFPVFDQNDKFIRTNSKLLIN